MNSRLVRVFISSTFRDFIEERDELVKKAFPELRRRCKERFVELLEVDLRWGITEEQAKGGETLRICLEEIDRCRPSAPVFFVGLLGERYGWIPPKEFFTKEVLEDPHLGWVKEHIEGKSVTELEILHGVLRNEAMRDKAFFYFRNDGYQERNWQEIEGHHQKISPPVTKQDFTNAKSEHGQASDDQKQRELKQAIRDASLAWDPRNYETPEEMGRMVLEDLWVAIDRVFPAGEVPDENERHRLEHEAFGQSRTKGYVNRAGLFGKLDVALSDDELPIVAVTGESGGGKSALLAAWLDHVGPSAPLRRFVHYIGGTPESSSAKSIVFRLMNQIRAWGAVSEPVPDDLGLAVEVLPEWLARAAAGQDGGLLLVLDALNQLESSRDRSLWWLPKQMPPGVRLVLSTLPGESEQELRARGWLEHELRVPPLNDQERKQIIAGYLGRFTKKLDSKLVDRLACAPQACNPLFLRVVLDELRIRARHEELGPMLERMLEAKDPAELFVQVLKNLEEFDKERKNLVREAMGCLAVARRGLSEDELLQLLSDDPQPSSNPLPRHYWSPLYLALEDSLVSRNGQLSFFHDYLQQAAEREYLDEDWERKRVHGRLGEVAEVYDSEKFSPALRRYSLAHGAWHLRSAGERERLWQLLSGDGYRRAQFDEFARADEAVEGLRHGIDFYAERNGEEAVDDARLCALALACGETVDAARASLEPVFSDFMRRNLDDPSRVEDAISRLQILDGSVYWLAAQLLIFIELHRSGTKLSDAGIKRIERIIESVETKVAPETEVLWLVWLEEALATGLPYELYRRLAEVAVTAGSTSPNGYIEQGPVAGSAPRSLMPIASDWKSLFACRALLKEDRWRDVIHLAELHRDDDGGWRWRDTVLNETAEALARRGQLSDALSEPALQSVFQVRQESTPLVPFLRALFDRRQFALAAEVGINAGLMPAWLGDLLRELDQRQFSEKCVSLGACWARWAGGADDLSPRGELAHKGWRMGSELFIENSLKRVSDGVTSLGPFVGDLTDSYGRDEFEKVVYALCAVGLGLCSLGERQNAIEIASACLSTIPVFPEAQRARVTGAICRLFASAGDVSKADELMTSLCDGYRPRDGVHEYSTMTTAWHQVATTALMLGDAPSAASAHVLRKLPERLRDYMSEIRDDEFVSAFGLCLQGAAKSEDSQLKNAIFSAAQEVLSAREPSSHLLLGAVESFAEVGEPARALGLARQIQCFEDQARSLAIAASAMLRSGSDEVAATTVWQEALAAALNAHGDHSKVRALNRVAETIVGSDKVIPQGWRDSLRREATAQLRQSTLEPELKAARLAVLGQAFYGSGDKETGESLMKEAEALASSIPAEEGKASGVFSLFAEVWGKTDPLRAARFVASGISAFAGLKLENLDILPPKISMVSALVAANRLNKAAQVASEVRYGAENDVNELWVSIAEAAQGLRWQAVDASPVELLASCIAGDPPEIFWDVACDSIANSLDWSLVKGAIDLSATNETGQADAMLIRLLGIYLKESRCVEVSEVSKRLSEYGHVQLDAGITASRHSGISDCKEEAQSLFMKGLQAATENYADLRKTVVLRYSWQLFEKDSGISEAGKKIDERINQEITADERNAEAVARGLAKAGRILQDAGLQEQASANLTKALAFVAAASVKDQTHLSWMLGGIVQELMCSGRLSSTSVEFNALSGGARAAPKNLLCLIRDSVEEVNDEFEKAQLLRDIAVALSARPDAIDEALKTCQSIASSWYKCQAASVLVERLCERGNFKDALRLVEASGDQEGSAAIIFGKIGASALFSYGSQAAHTDALELFDKGLKKLEAHPHMHDKAFWIFAEILLSAGKFPQREALFNRLVTVAKSLAEPWLLDKRSVVLALLAGVIARSGDRNAAQHLFKESLLVLSQTKLSEQREILAVIALSMISSRTELQPWMESFRNAAMADSCFDFLLSLPCDARRAWLRLEASHRSLDSSELSMSWLGSNKRKLLGSFVYDPKSECEVIRAILSLRPESSSGGRRLVAELAGAELRAGRRSQFLEIADLCPQLGLKSLAAA